MHTYIQEFLIVKINENNQNYIKGTYVRTYVIHIHTYVHMILCDIESYCKFNSYHKALMYIRTYMCTYVCGSQQ